MAKWAHARVESARLVERARMVWLSSQGSWVPEIADHLHLNEVAPAPQSTVAPELLVGNPDLALVLQAQALAAVIEASQNLTTEAPVQPVGELVGSR